MTTTAPVISISEAAVVIVDLLLQSAFSTRQDGPCTKFLFGHPGELPVIYRRGAEIYFSAAGIANAALQLRSCGPIYLRSLAISDLQGRLMDYLKDNYWAISDYVWMQPLSSSFAARVPQGAQAELVQRLIASQLLSPDDHVTVYPLVSIRVTASFDAGPFFLVPSQSLTSDLVGTRNEVMSTRFPPISGWNGRYETPTSWLGIRSPAESSAKRLRNTVLGALALLPHPGERYLFSGRAMFGGAATFGDGVTFSYGKPCTPPLMDDLVIDVTDTGWLEVLASKVCDTSLDIRRQMRALEYFYRAWPLPQVERFPLLFMALDAVFGSASQHTQNVVDAIGPHLGEGYDETRLKLLMKLRAAVIHGGAPDVYDSDHYGKYFEKYRTDPVLDFERIVARCLQVTIFEGKQVTRRHTHADLIKTRLGREP